MDGGGGVNIMAAAEKRVKYHCTMFWVTHNILLKLHTGRNTSVEVTPSMKVSERK